MKKILSIDGGGIRGIIPGQVLIALETKLQAKTNDAGARLASYFDFFAGTSTGGILTSLLLCPDDGNPGRPRFSAKDAVDLYVKYGNKIFDLSVWQKIKSADGFLGEKYNAEALEDLLKSYFGDLKLSHLLKPCIIPAYDIQERKATFFAQHDYALKGDGSDFFVRDVCRATSAAPTYFSPALIKSVSGVSYPFVDGGVFANNPTLCSYAEVRNAAGSPAAKDMYIVSLGTGGTHKSYSYDHAKNWGAAGWIEPVIDIMMAGAAEITHYQTTQMFSANHNENNYVRIQPENLRNASPDMDNATAENIQNLIEVGISTAENCPELDHIIDMLLAGPDPVVFRKENA